MRSVRRLSGVVIGKSLLQVGGDTEIPLPRIRDAADDIYIGHTYIIENSLLRLLDLACPCLQDYLFED